MEGRTVSLPPARVEPKIPRTRVLCVCNGGNVRSVTLARFLRRKGYEALSCGVDQAYTDRTLLMLFDWAEVIYIQRDSAVRLGERPRWQVRDQDERWISFHYHNTDDGQYRTGYLDLRFDVGHDDWLIPDHPDLRRRIRALYEG